MVGVIEDDSILKLFIPKLVEYYKEGKFLFDKLVKFYDFEDINKGFEESKSGSVINLLLK